MKRSLLILITALASSCFTTLALWATGVATLPTTVKLENSRVKVSEIDYVPGVSRKQYIRPTDQVIVFLDDCRYQRTDSATHEKTIRVRKSGDVIFHQKGDDAPVLTNAGSKTYRTLLIELK
jgi:hypothetical protein